METGAEVVGYWSDGTADVAVTVSLRNDGGLRFDGVQDIAVTCQKDSAAVSGCPEVVTMELPNGFGSAEVKFTVRTRMGTGPLAMAFSVNDGSPDTVRVSLPERILGVDRHVWECYSGLPGPMTRCGGWLGRSGVDAVYKWEPGKPIGVWGTGRQDYLAALDGILDQISELMNHTFVMVESREQADLVVGLGISSFPDSCIGGTGCGWAYRDDEGDPNTAAGGEAYVLDLGDNVPRRVITHELMHALIPQGHFSTPYHLLGTIEGLSAVDEGILRLHAHPMVKPGMTLQQVEKLVVFRDELLDASVIDVNTLAWRAREALLEEGTAAFNARAICLTGAESCESYDVQEFDWTDSVIGGLRLPGNHYQYLNLRSRALEAYVAGKEFWVKSSDGWRRLDWHAFSEATHWRPNYTSLLTVLENILLLAHEGDVVVTERADGKVVLETPQNRGLRLYNDIRMRLSIDSR